MRPVQFQTQTLIDLLHQQQVATMPDMLAALGAPTPRTVVRKLAEVPHLTSYSHRRRFYALRESAHFDERGLWSVQDIRFSAHGSLIATAEHLVCESDRGYLVPELDAILGVATTDALRKLARSLRLIRVKYRKGFLYVAPDFARTQQQINARHAPTPADTG